MNLRTNAVALTLALLPTTLGAELTAVPSALDLGTVRPKDEVRAQVLVVNETEAPVELIKASGSCGCTRIPDFRPASLAAGEARVFDVVVRAPEKVTDKKVKVVFAADDGSSLVIPVELATSEAEAPAATAQAAPGLHAFATDWVVTGDPESVVDSVVWIANTSEEPLDVRDVKGSCGCMTVAGNRTYTLAPGEARRVAFRVNLPEKPGRSAKKLTFVTSEGAPLVTRWTVETRAPQVASR